MEDDASLPPGIDHLPFKVDDDSSYIFRRPRKDGIWIPHGVQAPEPTAGFAFYSRAYVSYSDVFGDRPSRDDAVSRLRMFDLATILNTLGQISSAIHNLHDAELLEAQASLVRWLFENAPDPVLTAGDELLRTAREYETRTKAPVVFFHEQQLINAARLALLEVPQNQPLEAERPDALGEALLIINDLIGAHHTINRPPQDPTTEEERREWERFFFVNGYFHHVANAMADLVRSWDLYLTDRAHLEDSPVYLELPRLVEELTGLTPLHLWARLFAVYSHWGKGPDPDSRQLPTPLNMETHFTENFGFDPHEETAFWSLVAASPDEFREQFERENDGSNGWNPYDVLPFEKRPLVRLDSQIFCPSTLLMKRRITTGLHHIFLNNISERERRDRYLNYMGEVFEDYITNALEQEFGGPFGRLIREDELRESGADSVAVCDAVISYPDAALLVEVKAKRLRLGARVEGDLTDIDDALQEVFLEPARQIDAVIRRIEDGRLIHHGLAPERMRQYVPVAVTLDPLPMNPYTYDRFWNQVEAEDLLQQPATLPLQLLTAEDIEVLEMAASDGRNILDMLADRVETGAHRYAGFLNYLSAQDDPILREANPRIQVRFRELADEAVQLFKAKER